MNFKIISQLCDAVECIAQPVTSPSDGGLQSVLKAINDWASTGSVPRRAWSQSSLPGLIGASRPQPCRLACDTLPLTATYDATKAVIKRVMAIC